MGGEILEFLNERAERLEREARERGLKQGLKQGIEQGREQGLEQGREQGLEQGREQGLEQGREQAIDGLSAKLRDLGVDERLIEQAVFALNAERENADGAASEPE